MKELFVGSRIVLFKWKSLADLSLKIFEIPEEFSVEKSSDAFALRLMSLGRFCTLCVSNIKKVRI